MRRRLARAMVCSALVAGGCGSRPEGSEGVAAAALSDTPDYVVTAVSGPASATTASLFNVTTTICNVGGAYGPITGVRIVMTADAIVDASDPPIASRFVPGLAPQQCDTAVTQTGFSQDGAFQLGAIVDPYDSVVEDSETNNTLAGNAIGIGYGPDLVVTSVSGPPSANGQFRVAATVCNQGTQPSPSTDVRLYASVDTTITGSFESESPDLFLGSRPVVPLFPGQCDPGSIDVFAPGWQSGAFYLGAIVDEGLGVPELLESNNHTTGGLIGLGDGPDLVVTAISAPPSANGGFFITSTVCNQGTRSALGGEVALYASADTTITGFIEDPSTSDMWISGRSYGVLQPGQCDTETSNAYPSRNGAFYLGAIVTEFSFVPELIETNNHTTGRLIGFGDGPDLVVTAVTGPPSANGSFRITSTVCNQGTQWSSGADLQLYASSDTEITGFTESSFASDTYLGTRFVNWLAPGQCDTGPTDVFAPPVTGPFYLGAIIDETGNVTELIEANNHKTGGLIGLGNGPDLVVTAVSGPASANGAFQIRSTVCNQGTQQSLGADVRFYASTDPTITGLVESPFGADGFLGARYLGPLQPGQCDTGSTDAFAAGPSGPIYLGAIVDELNNVPELIEPNNRTTGALIGFGNGPDLVITSISGPPSANGIFQITATVCNQGTQASTATDLSFYLSTDTTITGYTEHQLASDSFFGSGFIDSLQPGKCGSASANGSGGWGVTGAFYLGGIIDESGQVSELIESNNHATGALIGIGDAPDLVVTSISGPPSANGAFQITTTVCNQGTQSSSGAWVELYASADTTITDFSDYPIPSDDFLGIAGVGSGWLAPGQCETSTTDAFAPPVTGAFYLGAIVKPGWGGELISSNNRTTGPLIGLGDGPDLVIASVSGPASANGPFTIASTVCNQGTQPSMGGDVRFYASPDATITGFTESPFGADSFLASRVIGPLQAGQCDSGSTPAMASGPSGAFYLGGIVDETNTVAELLETNNHTTGALIGLGNGPDLVVTSLTGPPSANSVFTITSTVCNQGTLASDAAEVRFYASPDPTITGSTESLYTPDLFLNSRWVQSLQPGQCDTASTNGSSSSGLRGPFYLGAIVDEINSVPELIESNNHATGSLIGLGNGPDLIVTSISAPPSANGAFQITSTVCNQGTQRSAGGTLQILASTDTALIDTFIYPSPDFFLAFRGVSWLSPGQCETATSDAYAPSVTGAYYLGAIVSDSTWGGELITSNNQTIGPLIGLGNGPDLVVTSVSGPPSASGQFSLASTVCNQGTQPTYGGNVQFYASTDTAITGLTEHSFVPDWFLGSRFLPSLQPGACDTASIDAFAPAAWGAFYLGAIVDEANTVAELIESNNHKTGTLIGFGDGPDLVITSVSGPPSANGAFEIASTVCNQGSQPSSSFDVRLYVSLDPIITGFDESPFAPPDTFLAYRFIGPLSPGQCNTGSVEAFGNMGVGYLGAIVDESNTVAELIESNNHTTGNLIGFGNAPDLVITAISAPPSASGIFQIDATICNQGTQPSFGGDVQLYASTDTTITGIYESSSSPDQWLNGIWLPTLQPGECTSGPVDAFPCASGTYHLGVIVDEFGSIPELIESNNHAVGPTIEFF